LISKGLPCEAARVQAKAHYEFKQLRSVREWVMISQALARGQEQQTMAG
jgi:hypothetical protein